VDFISAAFYFEGFVLVISALTATAYSGGHRLRRKPFRIVFLIKLSGWKRTVENHFSSELRSYFSPFSDIIR